MEERLIYKKEQFSLGLNDFEKSLSINLSLLNEDIIDVIRSGQAQKYEFTMELLWKTLKVFLDEVHGFQLASPKAVIKKFYNLEYIDSLEYEALINMWSDRNSLSHIYKKEQLSQIHSRIIKSLPLLKKVCSLI